MSRGAIPPEIWYKNLPLWEPGAKDGYYLYTGFVNNVNNLVLYVTSSGAITPMVYQEEGGQADLNKHWLFDEGSGKIVAPELIGTNWAPQIVEQMSPYYQLTYNSPYGKRAFTQEEIIGKLYLPV